MTGRPASPAPGGGAPATPAPQAVPPDRLVPVTAETQQPVPSTGDPEVDAELAKLRRQTTGIWERQEEVDALSKQRMRTVLALRDRTPPVLFRVIAEAVPTTEQTIYKIHREARRAQEAGEL